MILHPQLRKKAALRYNIELTLEDLEKTKKDLLKLYKDLYNTKEKLNSAFLKTVRFWHEDIDRLDTLIKIGANVNFMDGRALIICIMNNDLSTVKKLLNAGANPLLKKSLAIKVAKKRYKDIESEKYFTFNKERDMIKIQQIIKLIRNYEKTHQ